MPPGPASAEPTNPKAAAIRPGGKANTGSGGKMVLNSEKILNPNFVGKAKTDTGKDLDTPNIVIFGHELQHLADYDSGVADKSRNKSGIRVIEERAIRTENKIRNEIGLKGQRSLTDH